MKDRLIAAIAALLIVLPLIIYGGFWGTFALVLVISVIATHEFLRMLLPKHKRLWWMFFVLYPCVYAALALVQQESLLILGIASLILWMGSLFGSKDNEDGLDLVMKGTFGLLYISTLLSFFPKVRSIEPNGLAWIFLVLLITWSADTGAYFAGRAFGRNKLFERVSPKKTIEGVMGGLLLSIVVSISFQNAYLETMEWYHALALGALLCLLSVIGDLLESMVKRATGVKDSGNIMPGHGGIIDRLDSLLFTFPSAYIYYAIFIQ